LDPSRVEKPAAADEQCDGAIECNNDTFKVAARRRQHVRSMAMGLLKSSRMVRLPSLRPSMSHDARPARRSSWLNCAINRGSSSSTAVDDVNRGSASR